jgi:ketosteroid isomerase-like protein
MSQGNVEIIRAAMEAWNRGDFDGALKDAAPDMVLDNSMNLGEWSGVHEGAEQVRRMWQAFTENWESVRIEIHEFIEVEEAVVLTRQKAHFVGRDGIELPGPVRSGWVWIFQEGTLVRLTAYNDLDEALEAVGLSQ